MMMIGGFCPPSAADSYDVNDILMGSSLVLNDRRHSENDRLSLNKHVLDNKTLDLIIVAVEGLRRESGAVRLYLPSTIGG